MYRGMNKFHMSKFNGWNIQFLYNQKGIKNKDIDFINFIPMIFHGRMTRAMMFCKTLHGTESWFALSLMGFSKFLHVTLRHAKLGLYPSRVGCALCIKIWFSHSTSSNIVRRRVLVRVICLPLSKHVMLELRLKIIFL